MQRNDKGKDKVKQHQSLLLSEASGNSSTPNILNSGYRLIRLIAPYNDPSSIREEDPPTTVFTDANQLQLLYSSALPLVMSALKEGESKYEELVKLLIRDPKDVAEQKKQFAYRREQLEPLWAKEQKYIPYLFANLALYRRLLTISVGIGRSDFVTLAKQAIENNRQIFLDKLEHEDEKADFIAIYDEMWPSRLKEFIPFDWDQDAHTSLLKNHPHWDNKSHITLNDQLRFDELVLDKIKANLISLRDSHKKMIGEMKYCQCHVDQELKKAILDKGNSGVPPSFRESVDEALLDSIKHTVDPHTVDEETGDTLALLAIQMRNHSIFSWLIKVHDVNLNITNYHGFSATNYLAGGEMSDEKSEQTAKTIIRGITCSTEKLEEVENQLNNYLIDHRKRAANYKEAAKSYYPRYLFVTFMRATLDFFFGTSKIFDERKVEAEHLLAIIRVAKRSIPPQFYATLKSELDKIPKGLLNRSELRSIIEHLLSDIEADCKPDGRYALLKSTEVYSYQVIHATEAMTRRYQESTNSEFARLKIQSVETDRRHAEMERRMAEELARFAQKLVQLETPGTSYGQVPPAEYHPTLFASAPVNQPTGVAGQQSCSPAAAAATVCTEPRPKGR